VNTLIKLKNPVLLGDWIWSLLEISLGSAAFTAALVGFMLGETVKVALEKSTNVRTSSASICWVTRVVSARSFHVRNIMVRWRFTQNSISTGKGKK